MLESKITAQEIEEQIKAYLAEEWSANPNEINRETSFIEDLGADSLDFIELLIDLPEKFNIVIPEEEAKKIQTIGQAVDYIFSALVAQEE